jgi:hypothetical protein
MSNLSFLSEKFSEVPAKLRKRIFNTDAHRLKRDKTKDFELNYQKSSCFLSVCIGVKKLFSTSERKNSRKKADFR